MHICIVISWTCIYTAIALGNGSVCSVAHGYWLEICGDRICTYYCYFCNLYKYIHIPAHAKINVRSYSEGVCTHVCLCFSKWFSVPSGTLQTRQFPNKMLLSNLNRSGYESTHLRVHSFWIQWVPKNWLLEGYCRSGLYSCWWVICNTGEYDIEVHLKIMPQFIFTNCCYFFEIW